MWILNSEKTMLINTDNEKRFSICEKPDNTLVMYGTHIVGRYINKADAKKALLEIAAAIAREQNYFELDHDGMRYQVDTVKDARVKRKGGS